MTVSSVEEHLGLTGWSADGEGIGGVLKVRVEDFRVEEICLLYTSPSQRD